MRDDAQSIIDKCNTKLAHWIDVYTTIGEEFRWVAPTPGELSRYKYIKRQEYTPEQHAEFILRFKYAMDKFVMENPEDETLRIYPLTAEEIARGYIKLKRDK